VGESMQRMRFSVKETAMAQSYVTAIQTISAAPLFQLVKLGSDALETALAAFRALGDEAGEQAAQAVLQRLNGKPMTLKELAVSGNDLKPVFLQQNRPMREMGAALEGLWQAVIEGVTPNERDALLQHSILGGYEHQ